MFHLNYIPFPHFQDLPSDLFSSFLIFFSPVSGSVTFQVDLEIVTRNLSSQALPHECYATGRGHTRTHITDTCTQKHINIGRRWGNVLNLFKPIGLYKGKSKQKHVLLCCCQLSWHAIMTLNSSVHKNYDHNDLYFALSSMP